MSEATLQGLLDYLYSTLTPDNMRWMAMHLMAHADADEGKVKPYTIEELHQMVAAGEQQFAEGKWQDSEDMFRELEEEFTAEELQHTEAVAFWDTRREPIKQREQTIARNESAESRERSTEGQPKNQASQTK